ncbi:AAA family ATPase [Virgibacillus salarius]
MRPLKLTMTALGPYKDTETIDFTEIEAYRLFVISGNTGAGKTTIFDGICFALYGSASGEDREENMLRSDFADDNVHTAVELLFELGGRIFRILRQLGHVKQGNKTKTGDRYEFYELIDGNEIPCVDRQIVSEINKKIEALIGLTQDQFKQIVMLPQGEFRKLLTSKTDNKEEILRRLFKTEPYKKISERMREKKANAEQAYNKAIQARDQLIKHIEVRLPKRENSFLFQLLESEHYNINQVITGLQEESHFYMERIACDKARYEQAYEAHNNKQAEYHQAKAINDRFNEMQQKKARLNELDNQLTTYQKREKQLDDAERANNLIPYEKQRNDWHKEEEMQQKNLHYAENKLKTANERVKQVQALYKKEEDKKEEREQLRIILEQLKDYLPIVKEMDASNQQLNKLNQQVQDGASELEKLQKLLDVKNQRAEAIHEQIEKLDLTVEQLPDKQQRLQEMRDQVKVLIDYIELTKKHDKLEKESKQKHQEASQAQADYQQIERDWLNNQASILAAHLHDGQACPVCGSIDHPQKAINRDRNVSREHLEKAKQQFQILDTQYRNSFAEWNSVSVQLKERENELNNYSINKRDVTSAKEALVLQGQQLSEEVKQLHHGRKQLAEYKAMYEQALKETKDVEAKVKRTEQYYQEQVASYRTAHAVYQERIQKIPQDVRTLSELEKKIEVKEEQRKELEERWEQIQQKLLQEKEELTKSESDVSHASNQLQETKIRRENADKQFVDALSQASFQTEEVFQQAKLEEDERKQLKHSIEEYNQHRLTLQKQVRDLNRELKDKQQVELTTIEAKLKELKVEYEQALKTWDQSNKYYEEIITLQQNIVEVTEQANSLEKKLATITDLHDVLRGQNNKKISFERYLQIEYLEQIIDAANLRLDRLSNGQFFLSRSDRQESHGRQSGLGLDVFDAYTGQTRDVKSLSGGEKFNAALCLALGMSDVIQSFQGNISIETMFIDEGFGTLDEEALNKAVDTLVGLQQSGRMIGVISHVQELKAMFPAVLEVKKTKEGSSRAKFVVK